MSSLNICNSPSVLANKPPLSVDTPWEGSQCGCWVWCHMYRTRLCLQEMIIEHLPWAQPCVQCIHPEKVWTSYSPAFKNG